jgi:hypothetical protein
MSMFKGIATASNTARLPRLSPGIHEVVVDQIEGISPRGGGAAVITDYTVVKSGNPADPVGCKRSYYQTVKTDSLGFVKLYCAALLGVDPKDNEKVEKEISPVAEETMNSAISAAQPFRGTRLGVQVDLVADKKDASKKHANHVFSPVSA